MKKALVSLVSCSTLFALLVVAGPHCLAQSNHDSQVQLEGYKVFVSQAGAGMPVVVFESGMGEDLSTWQKVQPAVAKFSGTFAYDRAGLDKSEPSPNPKSVEAMTSELHALLRAAKIEPPYILVGHSLGGAIIQLYAHTYPAEIAGLVFVDPEDGRLLDKLKAQLPAEQWNARQKTLDAMMPKFSDAQKAELEGSKASGSALSAALPLPDVPVVLLTGTLKDPDFPGNPLEQDLKLALQNELLANLPHARHVLVPQSRHYIQHDAPDLVIDAIHDVLTQPQKSAPH